MSDSSDDDVAVLPLPRKRKKLIPVADTDVVRVTGTTSLTSLSSDFMKREKAIDSGPGFKRKKTELAVEETEKDKSKDYLTLLSSSSDDEAVFQGARPERAKSPSPPPALPRSADSKGKGRKRHQKDNRRLGVKRSAKVKRGLQAVQNLRVLHDNMLLSQHSQAQPHLSLNDSFGESKVDANLVVKVRSPSGLQRISIKRHENFEKVFAQMAEIEKSTVDRIVLTLNEERDVEKTETYSSLNLTIADIIECVVLREVETGAVDQQSVDDPSGFIKIKIQSLDFKIGQFVMVRVDPTALLSKMMEDAAKVLGVQDFSKLKFRFDGEIMNAQSTANDLDMEDDDCVDVISSNN